MAGNLSCTLHFGVIQQVIYELALALCPHQIGLPEDAQVLRRDRLFDVQRIINLLHTCGVFVVNNGADAHPQRVRQCPEDVGRGFQMVLLAKAGSRRILAHVQSDYIKIGFVVFAGKYAISLLCHLFCEIKMLHIAPGGGATYSIFIEFKVC